MFGPGEVSVGLLGADLQALVDEMTAHLGVPVTVEDRDLRLVAHGVQRGEVDDVRLSSILLQSASREVRTFFESFGILHAEAPVRIPADPTTGVMSRLCMPARWRGHTYGYVWALEGDEDLSPRLTASTTDAVEQVGRLLAQREWARRRPDPVLVALLDTTAPGSADELARAVAASGRIARETPVRAVAVRLPPGVGDGSIDVSRMGHRGLVSLAWPYVALVVPTTTVVDPGDLGAQVLREVFAILEASHRGVAHQAVVGVGDPRDDLAEVSGSWREAVRAAGVALRAPRCGPVAQWSDLGILRLASILDAEALRAAVMTPAVRQLVEHANPDLVRTARVYLDEAGDVVTTARALVVHRQTVYQRLARIEEVTGLDMTSGEHRLQLHLGLVLSDVLEASPASVTRPRR